MLGITSNLISLEYVKFCRGQCSPIIRLRHLTICCLVSFLFLFLSRPVPCFSEDKPVGKVIGVVGTVEIVPAGAKPPKEFPGGIKPIAFEPWEKVKFHQVVYAKDQFRTHKRSRLKILFSDNSLMALGPNSSMTVESYLVKPEQKLRQGVIKVAKGLSMYIVNKGQKNKKSSFRIVSPTANIAARGTQGYVSSSPNQTLLANQSGVVQTSSSSPGVKGSQMVGKMQKTVIQKGKPPLPPAPMSTQELKMIRSVVVASTGVSAGGGANSLIEVEEPKADKEEESDSEESSDSESASNSEDTSGDSGDTADSEEGGKKKGGDKKGGKKDGGDKVADTEGGGKGGDKAEGGREGGEGGREPTGDAVEAGGGDAAAEGPAGAEPGGKRTGGGGEDVAGAPGEAGGGTGADMAGGGTDMGGTPDMGSAPDMGGAPDIGGATAGGGMDFGGASDMGGSSNMGGAPDMGSAPDIGGAPADFGGTATAGGGMDFGGGADFGGFANAFAADFAPPTDMGGMASDFTPVNTPFDVGTTGGCSP